ncbi:MAG: helix-turn-helix transcriptional regulator [Clostridia bacterium]|nr:helix-turn-helix transcriptional regulator [Clostridia bacterium]
MTLFTKKSDENKNEETTSTLGARIAELRKKKGYTQEEFSDMLGVSPQAVSKWENDLSCPDIMLIPQIASILGITTDELLTGKAPEKVPAEEKTEIKASADASKLKLRIQVLHPSKKPVNISLPLLLVKKIARIGNGISGIVGSDALSGKQMEQILSLVDNGISGEILNIVAEDDTNVIIEIS